MEFYASWGKQDCARPGHTPKKTVFDIIRFEADDLSSAKSKATRRMKKDSRMERYFRTEFEGAPVSPPRWEKKWSEPGKPADAPDMLRTVKKSEGLDYPVTYVNPENDPGDQSPGHFGWVSVTWTPEAEEGR